MKPRRLDRPREAFKICHVCLRFSDSLQVDVVAEVVLIEERAARPKKLLQANILDLFHKKAKTSGPATQDLRYNIDGRD